MNVNQWTAEEGTPAPLGLTSLENERAVNFALYSNHATEVTRLLYRHDDAATPTREYRLILSSISPDVCSLALFPRCSYHQSTLRPTVSTDRMIQPTDLPLIRRKDCSTHFNYELHVKRFTERANSGVSDETSYCAPPPEG